MYIYLVFIGWISGISFMGSQTPQYLNGYLCLSILFGLILLFLKWFKFSITQHFIFKCTSWIFIISISYLLGVVYADYALEKRLSLRITQQNLSEQIIYIDSINKVKNKTQNTHSTSLNTDQSSVQTEQLAQSQYFSRKNQNQSSIQQRVIVLAPNHVPVQMLMYVNEHQAEVLQLGHYYKAIGQIKSIHGYAVAGTFDKEKWFIQENILGILKIQDIEEIDENQVKHLGYSSFVKQKRGFFEQISLKIEKLRLHFRSLIADSSLQNKGLLLALLTGDESLLSDQVQDLFKTLGISHLLAISGPHVLIFAAIFCFILNLLIKRIYPKIYLKVPRPYLLVYPFLICVIFYTAFVGFEIPALRTMLTVSILSLILLFKQKIQPLKHLLLTASILLLIDPFSILSAAFWLSFGACLILIRVYQTIQQQPVEKIQSWKLNLKLYLKVLIESQWKIFIALLPIVLWIFQQVSWITPLSNLVAIPLIGILIVPVEVFAACLSLFFEPLGMLFFQFGDFVLSILIELLNALNQFLNFQLHWWAFNRLDILCIALAVFVLFLPRGVIPKFWTVLCLIPLFLPHKNQYIFQLNILDVGQGQAIFINLPHHKMLVDTGGNFDENKFSIGKNIIIPFLMRQGISSLDRVILTHLDQDHSGAFSEVIKEIKVKMVLSNERDQRFEQLNFEYCHQGQQWQYDGVKIEILSPSTNSLSEAPNNRNDLSCVIYVQVPQSKSYQNFLIMADAGWETEFKILQQYPDLKVDVLVLGHHGSQHSSSYAFLEQFKPKLAIASAGFENRYGHPHPIVLERLKALDIPFQSTIEQGSIEFNLQANGQMSITNFRNTQKWLLYNK